MFDEPYREKTEVEEWKGLDPIQSLIRTLKERDLITDDDINQLELMVGCRSR